MPRLTKSKSWNFSLNNRIVGANANESCKIAMLLQKNTLVSWGWTVVRSCNKTNIADADLWNTIADVNWASSAGIPRSWIILKHPLHSMQICFFLTAFYYNGSHKYFYTYMSRTGTFTGNSTTLAPTAPDAISLYDATAAFTSDTVTPVVLSMMQSTDQSCLRILRLANNGVQNVIFFETLAGQRPELSQGIMYVGGALANGYTHANFQRQGKFRSQFAGAEDTGIRLASLGVSAVGLGETWNTANYDGVLPSTEIYPYSVTHKLVLGKMQDLWLGPSATVGIGDTYPSETQAKQFAQFNHFVFPWDGSDPIIN